MPPICPMTMSMAVVASDASSETRRSLVVQGNPTCRLARANPKDAAPGAQSRVQDTGGLGYFGGLRDTFRQEGNAISELAQ